MRQIIHVSATIKLMLSVFLNIIPEKIHTIRKIGALFGPLTLNFS